MMQYEIPVYSAGAQVGAARITEDGLYWAIDAEIQRLSQLLRLYLLYPSQLVPVGIFVPEGSECRCLKRISRRQLPAQAPVCATAWGDSQACWRPGEHAGLLRRDSPDGWCVAEPLRPGRPLQLRCSLDQIQVEQIGDARYLLYPVRYVDRIGEINK